MTTWRRLRWIGLAAIPSSLMLGVTTHITTDLSPIPLFWLIQLTIYLLSFILVFSKWPVTWVESPHTFMLFVQPALICIMIFIDIAGPHMTTIWGPIIANVWWGIPFFAITLLAALQAIPRDLYEAASIDGANAFKRFKSITLPFLAPTIAITILLRTVWIANFADLIVVMTNGGPADRTQIVASYIFTQAFRRLDFGYASAIAVVLLVLLMAYALLIVLLRQSLLKRA